MKFLSAHHVSYIPLFLWMYSRVYFRRCSGSSGVVILTKFLPNADTENSWQGEKTVSQRRKTSNKKWMIKIIHVLKVVSAIDLKSFFFFLHYVVNSKFGQRRRRSFTSIQFLEKTLPTNCSLSGSDQQSSLLNVENNKREENKIERRQIYWPDESILLTQNYYIWYTQLNENSKTLSD